MTSAPPRFDLFTLVHKALRRLFFDTAILVGRTDFALPSQAAQAQRAVATCFAFAREHAEHEDHHLVPQLVRLAPHLAGRLASEHPALERAAIAVESLWPRMVPLGTDARRALGAELARRFHAFVAAALSHMDGEEREVNAALWIHLTDADLGTISDHMLRDIPPSRIAAWREITASALSPADLEGVRVPNGAIDSLIGSPH